MCSSHFISEYMTNWQIYKRCHLSIFDKDFKRDICIFVWLLTCTNAEKADSRFKLSQKLSIILKLHQSFYYSKYIKKLPDIEKYVHYITNWQYLR